MTPAQADLLWQASDSVGAARSSSIVGRDV
jgi:hypothetical protein